MMKGEHLKDKSMKPITNDKFMKFLITICYVFMLIALISAIVIGITTQELIASCASMVILTMFTLLLLFFTIILFAYSTELERKKETKNNNTSGDCNSGKYY